MTIEYGTRPYVEKDGDELQHVDRMRKNTYFNQFNSMLEKHSEFMKPYQDDWDFPQMENYYPDNWQGGPGEEGNGTPAADLSGKGVCVISCYAPLYCDDPVECHMSRMETPPGMDPREAMSHVWMTALENHSDGTGWHYVEGTRLNLQSKMKKGDLKKVIDATPVVYNSPTPVKLQANKASAIFPMTIDPPSTGWGKWPENPMTRLIVKAMDPAGNLCETKLNAFCRKAPCCWEVGYVAMTFDDGSTADTIAPGNSITVFVVNGCGPYNWSVSGQGYSFASSKTDGPSNTLSLVNAACGTTAGKAGPVGTVTITDDCGTTVTSKIRSTGGKWSEQCTYGTDGCGYDDPAGCIGCGISEQWFYGTGSSKDQAWKVFSYACRGSGCFWGTYGSCVGMGAPKPPDCSAPGNCPCPSASCSHGGYTCVPQSLGWYLWVCA